MTQGPSKTGGRYQKERKLGTMSMRRMLGTLQEDEQGLLQRQHSKMETQGASRPTEETCKCREVQKSKANSK